MDMTIENAVGKKISVKMTTECQSCVISMAKFLEAKWLVNGTKHVTEIRQNIFLKIFM